MKFIKYFFRKKNVRKYFFVSNSFVYNKIYSLNNDNNNRIQYINNNNSVNNNLQQGNNNVQQLNNILQVNNINMNVNCNITKKILRKNRKNAIIKFYLKIYNIEYISSKIVSRIYDLDNLTLALYDKYKKTGIFYDIESNPVDDYGNFCNIMEEIYKTIDNYNKKTMFGNLNQNQNQNNIQNNLHNNINIGIQYNMQNVDMEQDEDTFDYESAFFKSSI